MPTHGPEGVLLVDKPAGMTSHDVVSVARRALGERRVGHAGTLDPFATGLLVVMVGRATRLLPYVSGEPKVYEATIRFGTETETDDRTGAVVREAALPATEAIATAIPSLTGDLQQLPPAYSAKKVGGVRSYAAARQGETLELAPARVTVHAWEIDSWSAPDLRVTITCGGGTYIRALARDLGRATGSAAHLVALRRLRSGVFDVGKAATVDALRDRRAVLMPPIAAVPELPVRMLDAAELVRVGHGQAVGAGASDAARVALIDAAGALVAIADRDGDDLHPRMVLRAS